MKRFATYVICTSPRSGSTLLCDMLRSTGVAGNPESWFHRPDLSEWAEALGVSLVADADETNSVAALFEAARKLGTGSSELFGLRLQRDSFEFFFETLRRFDPDAGTDLERFERAFGSTVFIHLSRTDKIAQAVSCVRAMQTGLWHMAADGSELERSAPHRDPTYDRPAIEEHVETFTQADRLWADWFLEQNIAPVRISYAELADDPALVTRSTLTSLGLDPSHADNLEPGVRKLADATSEEWGARFRAGLT